MPEPKDTNPEENKGTEDGTQEEEAKEPELDAFGIEKDGQKPEPEKKETKDGDDGDKGKDKKDVDIENHPVVVALKQEIENVKREYGGNLSGQRDKIKVLEAKIAEYESGEKGKEDDDVPFKEIKRSKDLKAEEREEMTDTEIRQMDQIADMQELANKNYLEGKKKDTDNTNKKVEDLNSAVRAKAKELAGDNTELANQIIESAKMFNLEGLTSDELNERVENAAKLVPDYKPQGEQEKKPAKKAVKDTPKSDDPFGVDKIVEEATGASEGSYDL